MKKRILIVEELLKAGYDPVKALVKAANLPAEPTAVELLSAAEFISVFFYGEEEKPDHTSIYDAFRR